MIDESINQYSHTLLLHGIISEGKYDFDNFLMCIYLKSVTYGGEWCYLTRTQVLRVALQGPDRSVHRSRSCYSHTCVILHLGPGYVTPGKSSARLTHSSANFGKRRFLRLLQNLRSGLSPVWSQTFVDISLICPFPRGQPGHSWRHFHNQYIPQGSAWTFIDMLYNSFTPRPLQRLCH